MIIQQTVFVIIYKILGKAKIGSRKDKSLDECFANGLRNARKLTYGKGQSLKVKVGLVV